MTPRCTAVLTSMLLAACAPAPPPIAVTCVDPNGTTVADANVTLHTNDTDGSTILLAQNEQRIGCATLPVADRGSAATVSMWPRITVRGRVQTPAGHAAPVHVSVVHVHLWRTKDPTPQGMDRTWSPSLHRWLPAIESLDTTAAPDGTFSLPVATNVSTIVAFTSPGLEMTQRWADHVGGEPIELRPEHRVEITALGVDGQPFAGANIDLFELRGCGNGMEFDPMFVSWQQRTAADGTATFDGLPPRYYFVSFDAPGAARQLREIDCIDDAVRVVTLRADPGILVRGFVRDETGRGVPGVAVIATAELLLEAGTTRTDANGAYELRVPRAPRPAIVRLSNLPDGWRDTSDLHDLDLATTVGSTHALDFTLQRR